MEIRFSEMMSATAETVLRFDGEDVALCYLPNVVTIDLTDTLDADAKAADEAAKRGEDVTYDWVTAQLEPVLEWWDVLEDNDNRMPPTVENMRRMPLRFLMAVLTHITNEQQVEPGESKGSDVG